MRECEAVGHKGLKVIRSEQTWIPEVYKIRFAGRLPRWNIVPNHRFASCARRLRIRYLETLWHHAAKSLFGWVRSLVVCSQVRLSSPLFSLTWIAIGPR